MGKYKALAKNAAILSIGTFLSKLITFFMVRFYTGVLTPAEYGTGDLIITTVSLLMPFVSLGISNGVFRFATEYPTVAKSIFSTGIFTVAAGIAVSAVLMPFLGFVSFFKGNVTLLFLMTAAACGHSLCEQFVRAMGDTVLFAKQGILNTVLVVTLNILFLTVFRFGVTGYVMSVGAADFITTVYLVIKRRLWRFITFRPKKSLIRKMLRYSIPLIPTTIFWWITSVSDRYMITIMRGSEANGIYTVANKIPTMLTLFSGVIMQAWQYEAVKHSKHSLNAQKAFYGNVWFAFSGLMFLLCSLMTALSKTGIRLIAADTYFSAWRYVPILCSAMLFCSLTSFMGSIYTVTKKSEMSLFTALLGAVINILLNLVLIPSPLGMYGAAIATLASYVSVFILRTVNVRRMMPFFLFGKYIIIFTALNIVGMLFISLDLPGWQVTEAFCVIATALTLFIGYKKILLK